MKNYPVVVLILLISMQLRAQESWSLKQCIEYGLKNNRNNTIYANQKKAADARAREALADYLPSISLNTTLDINLKVQQSIIPAGIFGDEPLRVAFAQKYNTNGTAQLDQVIYDQALLTGLKANKYNKEYADLNIQNSQEAIIYNISTAFFQISVYNQQIEVLKSNEETYGRQMEIYKLQVDKGVTLSKDLDKVTVDYNNTLSKIRVANSNLQLAENELKFEMGYPIDDLIKINATSAGEISPILMKGELSEFSVTGRSDYLLSEVNIKLLAIQQDKIRAEGLPKLTAFARYGAVGFGDKLNDSYGVLSPFSAIGFKLNIPVLNFYRRNAQYTQAKIERINAEEQLKIDEGRYKVEYQNANTKLIQAKANLENDQRNVTLAESVLKTTDLQLQKGVTDLTDWLTAQNALKEAQNSYLNSMYNYFLARIDLEKAAGTLKTFYNSL